MSLEIEQFLILRNSKSNYSNFKFFITFSEFFLFELKELPFSKF